MKKRKGWYQIRAASGDEAEILIYDDIGPDWFGEGISAERLVDELKEITAPTLNVRINSAGGQVFEGLAIYNALERHPSRVVTHIDGIAASIASVIALAGDEVRIAENAFLMIHDPHGVAIGNARDMREMADVLDKVAGSLVGVYAKRTGRDRREIEGWMQAETWFNAEEALEFGFVDQVGEARDVEASISAVAARFQNAPAEIAARLRTDGTEAGSGTARLPFTATRDAAALHELLAQLEGATSEPAPTSSSDRAPAGPARDVMSIWAESQRLLAEALP